MRSSVQIARECTGLRRWSDLFGYVKKVKGENLTIGVHTMPQRKKPCLVVMKGNEVVKYASFNNDYAAKEFMDIFAQFLGIGEME